MADKWATIDLPVLQAIDRLYELVPDVKTDLLAMELHRPRIEIERSLRRLYDAEFIDGINATTQGEEFDLLRIRLLERGLEAVGAWPSDAYDDLLRALRESIDSSTSGDEKTRLQSLLDGVLGAGKEVAVSVLSEWAKRQAGL